MLSVACDVFIRIDALWLLFYINETGSVMRPYKEERGTDSTAPRIMLYPSESVNFRHSSPK